MNLKGLIFDLDGTLADTALDFDAMRRELGIHNGTPLLEHLATLTCPEAIARFHDVVESHELRGAESATWIGDAEAVLHQLHDRQIPMAIVTRNMRRASQRTIERLGIPIARLLTREDVQEVKPHPEALLTIAEEWQLATEELAYVGDFTFDLQAARAAGMHAVLWRNGSNAHLIDQADLTIERFDQLLPLLTGTQR